jgi:alpha-tubulin suppressor-like RCC1 family protein
VRTEMKFTTVSAGFTHTCGLVRDGSAWCWGANDTAQLGDGSLKNSPQQFAVRCSTMCRTADRCVEQ